MDSAPGSNETRSLDLVFGAAFGRRTMGPLSVTRGQLLLLLPFLLQPAGKRCQMVVLEGTAGGAELTFILLVGAMFSGVVGHHSFRLSTCGEHGCIRG